MASDLLRVLTSQEEMSMYGSSPPIKVKGLAWPKFDTKPRLK